MLLDDQIKLRLPGLDRVLTEDVKDRVILRCCEGYFQNLPDEIWHDSAASAPLDFQMGDIRNRHVIGELESVIPV